MIEFRFSDHLVLGSKVVEVWIDNRFIASFYGQAPDTIRIISKYMADVKFVRVEGEA